MPNPGPTSSKIFRASSPTVVFLDEGIVDANETEAHVTAASLADMHRWATQHKLGRMTNAVALNGVDLDTQVARLLSAGGLPERWTVHAHTERQGHHHLVVRTSAGHWVLTSVSKAFDPTFIIFRPVMGHLTLGALCERFFRSDFSKHNPSLVQAVNSLLSGFDLDEDERAEQMLSGLSGFPYVPRAAYRDDSFAEVERSNGSPR